LALQKAGGFSVCTATEDIDITWKLHRAAYEIWFAPEAVAYIQIPNTFKDLWKQRCRWATGGCHMLRRM
jgi:biofilm PGA synthesis N-glycosyltransferase PgaC